MHQTLSGATARAAGRPGPSRRAGRLRPGWVSSRRVRAHASGRLRRGLHLLLPQPARPRLPYLRLQTACAQAASTSSGPARRGPTRPRPRSPRVSEEERRLRNRQPPPVPPPPATPLRRALARCRRRHDQWERRPVDGVPSPRDERRRQPIVSVLAEGGGHVGEVLAAPRLGGVGGCSAI